MKCSYKSSHKIIKSNSQQPFSIFYRQSYKKIHSCNNVKETDARKSVLTNVVNA